MSLWEIGDDVGRQMRSGRVGDGWHNRLGDSTGRLVDEKSMLSSEWKSYGVRVEGTKSRFDDIVTA